MVYTLVLKSLNDDDDTGIASQVYLKTSTGTLKPLCDNCVINTEHQQLI